MENIPKISQKAVNEQLAEVNSMIVNKTVNEWVGLQLKELKENNYALYNTIVERCKKVAMGVIYIQDSDIIASSLIMETLILLKVIDEAYRLANSRDKFDDFMSDLLAGNDLKGLDKLNE